MKAIADFNITERRKHRLAKKSACTEGAIAICTPRGSAIIHELCPVTA